jgi:hypothetical protein
MNTPAGSRNLGVVVAGLVLALVVSVGGAGYFYFEMRRVEAERQEAVAQARAEVKPLAPQPANEADRLREMLAEKETAYAQLQSEVEQLKQEKTARPAPSNTMVLGDGSNLVVTASTDGGRGFGRGRFGGPEAEARMRESRDQFRQQAEARRQEQLARLQERRQQAKTPEEAALLDQLIASFNQVQEVGQQWESLRDPAVTNRAALAMQLAEQSRAAYAAYNELRAKDRQFQLQQLAAQAGYKDAEQAKQFTDAVQRIYDETDSSLPRLMGFGGFGRGGGGGSNTSSLVILPGR